MFVLVTNALERDDPYIPNITKELDKDHILYFEVPAKSDTIKNGIAIARYVGEEEFNRHYWLEDDAHAEEFITESEQVEQWLKEHNGHIIDST